MKIVKRGRDDFEVHSTTCRFATPTTAAGSLLNPVQFLRNQLVHTYKEKVKVLLQGF